MEKMSVEKFDQQICQYVKAALPHELEGTDVYAARLNMGEGETHMILLVIRPWYGEVTVFCLDNWYKSYADGNMTVESAVAAIINDRRLYNMSLE